MKNYNILIFILILLTGSSVISSCSKGFLDLTPKSSASEATYYKTEKDFETAIVSAYATLYQEYAPMGGASFCGELMSDEATVYDVAGASADVHAFRDYTLMPSNTFVLSIWRSEYNSLMILNTILEKMEGASISEATKAGYAAEVRFLRALYHFNLVRMFGDVPIVRGTVNESDSYSLLRSPISEVYDFILDDLKFAAANLPLQSQISRVGQATKGAALGILGEVYLTLSDKQNASIVLKEIIDSKEYKLLSEYSFLWDLKHENSEEALFEVQHVAGPNNPSSPYWEYFSPYNNLSISAQGRGINQVSDDLWNEFESGDPRRDLSIFDGYENRSGNWIDIKFPAKWYDPSYVNSLNFYYENNFIVLRYADILLMYAEASGDVSYLNLVRDRVGLPRFGEAGYPSNISTLEQAIEHERMVELSLEFHRWFDLKRTGRAKAILSQRKDKTITDEMLVLPIPQEERDINPDLSQNTYYH